MAKGDKPQGSTAMPLEEVAAKLRVTPEHVKGWVQKGELRASDAGIKPYDFNKFKLDHDDEIRKAQADAKANKSPSKTNRKPSKKGFFSKFRSLFGSDKSEPGDKNAGKENKRLKAELDRFRAQEPEIAAERDKLEEKIRYLESNMSRTRQLESENSELKSQLAIVGAGGGAAAGNNEALEQQLAQYKQELESTKQQVAQSTSERDALAAQLSQAQQEAANPNIEAELQQTREALAAAQSQLQSDERDQTIEQLRAQLAEAADPAKASGEDSQLATDLLAVQQTNFQRFQRLHQLYQEAKARLEDGQSLGSGDPEATKKLAQLRTEFDALSSKHKALLASQDSDQSRQEFAEQLSAARVTTTRLKQENTRLKATLAESGDTDLKKKVAELEQKLQETQNSDATREVVESELRSLRKSLQGREAQVQKIAGRLQENERALKKALEESARLTELLIERENKLRDLSSEYETEYQDKIDNLDRQVSGLQWKLSLREERIATLESEVNDLKRSSG